MKSLLLIMILSFSSVYASEPAVIKSNDEDYELSRLPQNFIATFADQRFKLTVLSPNVYDLTIVNLRCDYYSRDGLFPGSFNAGLPRVNCFVNAEVAMNGKGTPVLESRYIVHLLNLLEAKKQTGFSDCIMGGKCITFVNKINCIIDQNKAEMREAYTCSFQ